MSRKPPSPDFAREFNESMPLSYRKQHRPLAIQDHAAVALARGGRSANVELLERTREGLSAVCVVADDRPGLLATISAAFVLSGLDVMDAEAHTRRTSGGRAEAVDLFWVRQSDPARRGNPVSAQQVAEVESILTQLLEGKLDPEAASQRTPLASAGTSETIVRFLENHDGDLSTLEVETGDRSGLLLALSRALFVERVQIVESSVKTLEQRVFDRFQICELDGSPINPARRLQIQVAVLSAIQPAAIARPQPGAKREGKAAG